MRLKKLNNKAPLAKKLIEARLSRGLSISELAEKIGVSRQAISKYETGQSIPSMEVFNKIVQQLRFPVAYFLTDDNIETKVEGPLFYRSLKSADKKNRTISEIRTIWMNRLYSFINKYIQMPQLNLPEFPDELLKDIYAPEDIEYIAKKTREFWNLGTGPINNLTFTMEKNGFIITRLQTYDLKIDAFSRPIGGRPFIFLGADKNCAVRSRFDLAHELGHFILHRYITADELLNPKTLKRIEDEANNFAASFLLPKDTFGMEIMSTSLNHFILLKKRWKVSIQAMIYRCHNLGYLSDDQTLYLRKKMSRLNMRKNEPLDDILVPEKPVVLRQAVEMLFKENILTKEVFKEIFNLPVDEMEELLCLEPGSLSESAKVINLKFK